MHVCMYVCVCIYACMYVRTHVYMYVCMLVCMHACMYVCTYVRMYVCIYVCYTVCMFPNQSLLCGVLADIEVYCWPRSQKQPSFAVAGVPMTFATKLHWLVRTAGCTCVSVRAGDLTLLRMPSHRKNSNKHKLKRHFASPCDFPAWLCGRVIGHVPQTICVRQTL